RADLPPGSVTALATEPDGSLWLAAGTGRALYRIHGASGKASPVAFPHDDTSLMVAMLWRGDARWVAAGPLMRLTPATGDWRVYRHGADPDSLTDDSTTVMLPDGKGGLWVGTRRGLERLDPASGKFSHTIHAPADPHSLPSDFVASLLIDRRGRLWVSALGNGLAVADPAAPGEPL